MANISYYASKLKGHYREKGVIGGSAFSYENVCSEETKD